MQASQQKLTMRGSSHAYCLKSGHSHPKQTLLHHVINSAAHIFSPVNCNFLELVSIADPSLATDVISHIHEPDGVTCVGQGLENDEEDDSRAQLMECWPDNPKAINLGNILQAIAPLFELREYEDGGYLARQGEACKCVFYLQKGHAVVSHTLVKEGSDSEEDSASGEVILSPLYSGPFVILPPLNLSLTDLLDATTFLLVQQNGQASTLGQIDEICISS